MGSVARPMILGRTRDGRSVRSSLRRRRHGCLTRASWTSGASWISGTEGVRGGWIRWWLSSRWVPGGMPRMWGGVLLTGPRRRRARRRRVRRRRVRRRWVWMRTTAWGSTAGIRRTRTTWCARRGGPRRVVLGTRASPTRVRRWGGNSGRAGSGGGHGLLKSGPRVFRARRNWTRRCGRQRGRRCVVRMRTASHTPIGHWRRSSERACCGVRPGLRKSRPRAPRRVGRRRSDSVRRGGWKRVAPGTRVRPPTRPGRWERSSEGAGSGVRRGLERSKMRVVRAGRS